MTFAVLVVLSAYAGMLAGRLAIDTGNPPGWEVTAAFAAVIAALAAVAVAGNV